MQAMETAMLWIERLGFPTAVVIIIGLAIKEISKWAAPLVRRWIEANTEKQRIAAENQTRLTEKTIEIQQINSHTLQSLHEKIDDFIPCRYPMPHRARSRKKKPAPQPPTDP